MDELVRGVFKPEQVAYFQKVIGRLKAEGCDAVVLGCTEIPLIMNDAELAAADPRFDPPARPRRAQARDRRDGEGGLVCVRSARDAHRR